ncbi:MAG TPA: amidohydrolase family protein [Steroidobacteraceae bacterium]|nr:amidohydrolase family protein [Steroidobacteraceae bacterium]
MQNSEPADLLIEARWVLPIAPVATALAHHAVAIERGRIAALGPATELRERFAAREHIALAGHALLPGFVNAHTRAGQLLARGRSLAARVEFASGASVLGVADAPAQPWRIEAGSSADFARDGAQLAVAEMLRSGVTAFASRDALPEAVAHVASFARVRASIGLPIEERATEWADGVTGHLARAEALWDEYKADPWVGLHFAPDRAHALSDAALTRVRTIADELDARIAMPVHETGEEIERHGARHDVRPLRRLDALGLLSPSFTALYLNRLEDAEIELLARKGVAVAACPQASLRRGIGCCPLAALLERGVPVGLGTGSPASTFALDVLAEARAAALVASSQSRAPDVLSAHGALELATLGGAAALGLKAVAGSIEPGKAADLIAIDLSALVGRHDDDPAEAIVYGASRDRVTHVWINGTPRVAEGRLLAFDEAELLELARRWSARQ